MQSTDTIHVPPSSSPSLLPPRTGTDRAVPPLPPPARLPSPIAASNSDLLAAIFNVVKSCNYLVPEERLILLGVLTNFPSHPEDDDAMLRRILALDPPELQLLSTVFSQGLHAARNYGGGKSRSSMSSDTSRSSRDTEDAGHVSSSRGSKRSASCADGDNSPLPEPVPVSLKRPCLMTDPSNIPGTISDAPASASGTASPSLPMAPPLTPVANLLHTLGLDHDFPNDRLIPTHPPLRRRKSLAEACLTRQGNTCVITGSTTGTFQLETAHLVAHSVATLNSIQVAPYWRLLNIVLGPALTAHIYSIAGGTNSYRSSNGIAMNPILHSSLFDRGIFWLVPHVTDAFDIDHTHSYDVELVWRGSKPGMALLVSQLPDDPARQLDCHGFHRLLDTARPIKPGDRFRLQTHDPAAYPLPHPLLLDLHALLWVMIASSGAAETMHMKQIRTAPHPSRRGRRTRGGRALSSGFMNADATYPGGEAAPLQQDADSSAAGGPRDAVQHRFSTTEGAYLGLKLRQLAPQEGEYYDDECSDGYDSDDTEYDSEYDSDFDPRLVEEYTLFRAKMATKGY